MGLGHLLSLLYGIVKNKLIRPQGVKCCHLLWVTDPMSQPSPPSSCIHWCKIFHTHGALGMEWSCFSELVQRGHNVWPLGGIWKSLLSHPDVIAALPPLPPKNVPTSPPPSNTTSPDSSGKTGASSSPVCSSILSVCLVCYDDNDMSIFISIWNMPFHNL